MRKSVMWKTVASAVLLSGLSGTALGAEKSSAESSQVVGQGNFVELDAQVGSVTGLRLKLLLASGENYNLAIEGISGTSPISAVFSDTYGAGVRAEYYLSHGKRHAWMISPGVDGIYIPARPYHPEPVKDSGQSVGADIGQALGSAIGDAIGEAFVGVPTRVVLASPNVDLSWTYELNRNFGLTLGAKVGAAIALNGSNSAGESLAGKVFPDVGLYVGTRF